MPDRPAGNGLPLFALTVLAGGLAVGAAVLAFRPAGPPVAARPLPATARRGRRRLRSRSGRAARGRGLGVRAWLAGGRRLAPASAPARRRGPRRRLGRPDRLRVPRGRPDRPGATCPARSPGSGGSVGAFASVWLDAHFERTGADPCPGRGDARRESSSRPTRSSGRALRAVRRAGAARPGPAAGPLVDWRGRAPPPPARRNASRPRRRRAHPATGDVEPERPLSPETVVIAKTPLPGELPLPGRPCCPTNCRR